MDLSLSQKDGRKYNHQIDQRLRALRPNMQSEKDLGKQILENVRNSLQSDLPLNAADFQMGGSLEKDTMVVFRKEIDVIISLPLSLSDFPPTEGTRQWVIDKIALWYQVPRREEERFMNIIIYKSGFKVDLLPTFQIDLDTFLTLSQGEKHIYKPHMSLIHVEFIQSRGKKFQEFCRWVKYWAHGYADEDNPRYTSSFFLELVAADIWDRSKDWTYIQLFEAFLRRMKNILKKRKERAKFFGFNDYYKAFDYRDTCIDQLLVLDPVDPEDNIYLKNPQNEHLKVLAKRAKEALKLWKEKSFGEVFKKYFSRHPDSIE